jgi:diguanylate cyclase (GGDEF)-like protein
MAGDAVLVNVARVIRDSVRDRDVVARLGGDEFLVFAPECNQVTACEIAARIQTRASEQVEIAYRYSLSVGICIEQSAISEFDRMYQRADVAMYRAKAAGKNRFEIA